MGILNRIKDNFFRNLRIWGVSACIFVIVSVFGWKISCGIICVIILSDFITKD